MMAERGVVVNDSNASPLVIRHHSKPVVVTIDKSGANKAALATFNADKPDEETITVRQGNYLNNLIEQDHRNIKRRICHMIRKG